METIHMASQKQQLDFFAEEVKGNLSRAIKRTRPKGKRANDLDGKEWTQFSISVWSDIRKDSAERRIHHPAMFPRALAERVIRSFTNADDKVVLDPFMGSGATLIAACTLGKTGIGFEVYDRFVKLAKSRLQKRIQTISHPGDYRIYQEDARQLTEFLEPESVDLCFTSPPYWDILSQKRTADNKQTRDYGTSPQDLSRITSYCDFVLELANVFAQVYRVLKPRKYCIVNVMDIRKKDAFYAFHADLARAIRDKSFIFDDIIIWDRRQEYNNLRPLGFPSVFRINKVHEYLLIFQKP